MSLSPKSSCQPCLLMRLDIKCVGHVEGRRKIGWRKHKDIQPSEEKNWIHLFCLISCTKVKACVLAFIVTWFEEYGRKKIRKRWGNKRRGHSAIWSEEKSWWVRLRTLQSWRIVWVRAIKSEEKNIESRRKLWEIHSEEESSEWKEKHSFFFAQVLSLIVVISI